MPTSNLLMAPWVVHLVHEVPHRRVLDVGPGWGKYATLLREYLNERPAVIDAAEAWAPYIAEHHLERLYDAVFPCDVRDLNDARLATYDLVLMVDVIEHLDGEEAHALLARIPGRVVICTPVDYFHNGDGLPPTEEHRSHWTQGDWDRLAESRPIEAAFTEHGGWLVRLGPLADA